MRLADFIRENIELILQDWEEFAETLVHADHMNRSELRDHARDMLLVIADDIESSQTDSEQLAKSKGHGLEYDEESWAEVHGEERQTSGFSVMETASEFRHLRATVLKHWTKSYPTATEQQLEDLSRFHESIDQCVAESLEHYATAKEMQSRLFGAVLFATPDPIYVLDIKGRFIYANKAACDLLALNHEDVIGKSAFNLGFSFASEFQRNLEKVVSDQTAYRGKFAHTFPSGQGERFEYLLAPVLDQHRATESAVCIFRDVTEQTLAEEKIWHNAHHDLLTGLPNRRLFLDRLEQEVKHARRSNLPIAVLFMDLDGFKEINDSYGHEAGDRLLQTVADRLAECVREEDTVARLGGDEFTVLLTGFERRKDAELVAENIMEALAMPLDIEQRSVHISASIGIAYFLEDASSSAELLKAADHAMYRAKSTESGVSRVS